MPSEPCQLTSRRYPLALLLGRRRSFFLLVLVNRVIQRPRPARAMTPNHDAANLAVQASRFAELQVAVQLGNPIAQRQCPAGSVGGEISTDLSGGGVDEDCPGFTGAEVFPGIHHPGGVPGLRCGTHGNRAFRVVEVGVGRLDLGRQGQVGLGGGCVEFLGVHDLFHLRGQSVERPAECGDEDERADEDARIEVQPQAAVGRTIPCGKAALSSVPVVVPPALGLSCPEES